MNLPVLLGRRLNQVARHLLLADVPKAGFGEHLAHEALGRTPEQTGRPRRRRPGLPRAAAIAPLIVIAQGFASGALQTAAHTREPGLGHSCKLAPGGRDIGEEHEAEAAEHGVEARVVRTAARRRRRLRVSRLCRPRRCAVSAATASMPSAMSVTVTRPAGTSAATVSPGSPVPAATSSTFESSRRSARRIIAAPAGASQPSTSLVPLLPAAGDPVPRVALLIPDPCRRFASTLRSALRSGRRPRRCPTALQPLGHRGQPRPQRRVREQAVDRAGQLLVLERRRSRGARRSPVSSMRWALSTWSQKSGSTTIGLPWWNASVTCCCRRG